jgi:simple sugar transport system substrate-binding protein
VTEADKLTSEGKNAWAIPYDYVGSCEGSAVCLGVPYFNWGPAYLQQVKDVQNNKFKQAFEWNPPFWENINDIDQTAVGFKKGQALIANSGAVVDRFIKELSEGLLLWMGPLNLQDGTQYLKENEKATDQQIWYLPQLLEGMEGQSVPSE